MTNFTDLPRYAQDYTSSQRERVIKFYVDQPLDKGRLNLRQRQSIAEEQIKLAHAQGKTDVLRSQQVTLHMLTKAIMRKIA